MVPAVVVVALDVVLYRFAEAVMMKVMTKYQAVGYVVVVVAVVVDTVDDSY